MWQVLRFTDGSQVVSCALSESMTLLLARLRGPPLFVNIYTDEAEPRLFDKARLPILTVDGEHILDLNESMELQNLVANLGETPDVHCFSDDRQVGAIIWNGQEITPNAFIIKMMKGSNLHVRMFFHPFAMAEYNVSLNGLSEAVEQVFSISTAPPPRLAPVEQERGNPEALKLRLGPVVPQQIHRQRQSMGEMAVRTAVRATIWESVYSLFRLFR